MLSLPQDSSRQNGEDRDEEEEEEEVKLTKKVGLASALVWSVLAGRARF